MLLPVSDAPVPTHPDSIRDIPIADSAIGIEKFLCDIVSLPVSRHPDVGVTQRVSRVDVKPKTIPIIRNAQARPWIVPVSIITVMPSAPIIVVAIMMVIITTGPTHGN